MDIMPSKVYFADLRSKWGDSILLKFERLLRSSGLSDMDLEKRFVAIKTHFGEPGNMSALRPNYAKVIADIVKEKGGYPFLTDSGTLYVGRRKTALEHMEAAYGNGYTPLTTGCSIIIGDGLKGSDDVEVPVDGEYVKFAKIGRAVMDADVIVSLTHFKGHELTGFGGTMKNIGMGAASRAGKMEMHCAGRPYVKQDACVGCRRCLKACAHGAITVDGKASVGQGCVGCGRCISSCPHDAIEAENDESNDILNRKIVEYAAAVVRNRPCFHVSLAIDISPMCDCHPDNDIPVVPSVGMFASSDPVALDKACADAVNARPAVEGSMFSGPAGGDRFTGTHPSTDWRVSIEHAVRMRLGSAEYEIVEIE